jgi:ketosteroid isomerase-like protein
MLMKAVAILLVTLAVSVLPAKAPSEDIKRTLVAIEQDVVHGNETCDRAAIERVEADEFIFTSPAGKVTDKQQDLASLKDCRPSIVHAEIDDAKFQMHGEVAILNAQITEHPTNKEGQVVTRRYRFSDVFVWRDGRWQMVLGHASRIPDSKPDSSTAKQ